MVVGEKVFAWNHDRDISRKISSLSKAVVGLLALPDGKGLVFFCFALRYFFVVSPYRREVQARYSSWAT
jgi:hypothetical protein